MHGVRRWSLFALLTGALLSWCAPAPVRAQTRKSHPLYRAVKTRASQRALPRGFRPARSSQPGEEQRLSALLRLREGATREGLSARHPEARFGRLNGRVIAVEAPLGALAAIEQDPEIDFIEASPPLRLALDVVRSSAAAAGDTVILGALSSSTFAGFGGRFGEGVVIGIVDTGIDWSHRDFYTEGAPHRSRILHLWDHNDPAGPSPGSPYDYGTVWTRAQIDDELNGVTSGVVRSSDTDGHGTHVAGIAAGDGSETDGGVAAGTYTGMAPGSDLIVVKATFPITAGNLLDGVNFIIDRAAAAGKRAVINLSLASQFGPHDGTSALEAAIAAIAASTPVVVAMGNDHNDGIHASAVMNPGDSRTFQYQRTAAADFLTLDFWAPAGHRYTLTVSTSADGETVAAGPDQDVVGAIGGTTVEVYNETASPLNGDTEVIVVLSQAGGISFSDFRLFFVREASGGPGGQLHGYAADVGAARFTNLLDNSGTVSAIASAQNVIAVGSYCGRNSWTDDGGTPRSAANCPGGDLGDISAFSGRGPTRDGRQKPDITAPGDVVASALSPDMQPPADPSLIVQSGGHRVLNGTSMAAPVVAGVVALKIQENPALSASELRQAVQNSGRSDAKTALTGVLPNDVWGHGKVTAYTCTLPVEDAPASVLPAALGTSSISWTWGLTANATSYHVYYATNPALRVAVVAGPPFLLDSLSANTTYAIEVRGANTCSEGPGAVAAATSTLAVPLASVGPAQAEVSSVTVTYAPLPSAPREASSFGYLLQGSTAPDFTGVIFASATPNPAVGSLRLDGLRGFTTYYLRIATLNEPGGAHFVSAGSTRTNTSLGPPASVAVSSVAVSSAVLSWGLGPSHTAGLQYVAEAATDQGFSAGLQTLSVFSLSAQFTGLAPNATHYFRVRAATGPYSSVLATATLAAPPGTAAPPFTGVFLTSATANWGLGGNPAGTRFIAQASSDPAFGFGVSSSHTANTSWLLQGLDPNTTVYVRVQAVNHGGLPSGAVLLATSTLSGPPGAPPDPFIAVTSSLTVRWVPLPASPQSASCRGYLLEASESEDFAGQVHSARTSDPSASVLGIEGLAPLTTYYVRVGALNWNGVPNFVVLGATETIPIVISSAVAVSGQPMILQVVPDFPHLTLVRVEVPADAFPPGTAVQLNASAAMPFSQPLSNQAGLSPLGPDVGVALDAIGGAQPSRPLRMTMRYAPAFLPPGAAEDRLVVGNYRDGQWTLLPTRVLTAATELVVDADHLSPFAPLVVQAGSALDAVQVFPVPWMPGTGDARFDAQRLTFSNLPPDARVRLFTILGELVWEGEAGPSGIVLWDGRNGGGVESGSGTYLAVLDGAGGRKVRRVVVIR